MPSTRLRAGTLLLGLALFLGIAIGTATLYAVDCKGECQDCQIEYRGCDACGGGACEMWGVGCDEYCWKCGSEEWQCEPVGGG